MVAATWNGYTAGAFGVRFFAGTRTFRLCVTFDWKGLLVFFVNVATLVSKLARAVFAKKRQAAFPGFATSVPDLGCSGTAPAWLGLLLSRGAGRGESERPRTEPLLDPGLPLLGINLLGDPVLEPRGLSDRPRPAFSLSCKNGQSRPEAHLPCSNHW